MIRKTLEIHTVLALALVATVGSSGARAVGEFTEAVVCSGETADQLEVKVDPKLAFFPDGELAVVWQDARNGVGGDIYFNRTESLSGRFEHPIRVNDDPTVESPDWSWQHSSPSIAIDAQGTVYVAWSDHRDAAGQICPGPPSCLARVYVSRSTDGGRTFEPSRRIDPDDGGNQSSPRLAVGVDGRLHAVWRDGRLGSLQDQIFYARSDDGGASWSAGVDLTPGSSALQTDPALDVRGGVVQVVWADQRSGKFEIFATRSRDRGASFTAEYRAQPAASDADNARFPATALAGDGGAFFVWEQAAISDDDFFRIQIYFSYQSAGSFELADAGRLDDPSASLLASHPTVAVDAEGRPQVAFRDFRSGGPADIFFTRSPATAPPFSFDPSVAIDTGPVATRQAHPDLEVSPLTGKLALAWENGAKPAGGVDISVAYGGD